MHSQFMMHGQENIRLLGHVGCWWVSQDTHQQPSPYSQFSLKLCTDRTPGTLYESDSTICCMYTTVSSWRWALEARNMWRRI